MLAWFVSAEGRRTWKVGTDSWAEAAEEEVEEEAAAAAALERLRLAVDPNMRGGESRLQARASGPLR